jgi:hypothetical protein
MQLGMGHLQATSTSSRGRELQWRPRQGPSPMATAKCSPRSDPGPPTPAPAERMHPPRNDDHRPRPAPLTPGTHWPVAGQLATLRLPVRSEPEGSLTAGQPRQTRPEAAFPGVGPRGPAPLQATGRVKASLAWLPPRLRRRSLCFA